MLGKYRPPETSTICNKINKLRVIGTTPSLGGRIHVTPTRGLVQSSRGPIGFCFQQHRPDVF